MADENDDILDVLGRYYPPPHQRTILISTSIIRRAEREIYSLREKLDKIELAYIEAANPGIDMDEVKAERKARKHNQL